MHGALSSPHDLVPHTMLSPRAIVCISSKPKLISQLLLDISATGSGNMLIMVWLWYFRIANIHTNTSYGMNEPNPQTQQDPLYSVIDDQDSAHYTELPGSTHMPYYQEIQTDRVAAATAYEIPVQGMAKAGQQPGGPG